LKQDEVAQPERRRTKVDFFKIGLQLLAEGGITTVTIANLCARLHVTKGSFYHHFASGPEFQRELLAYYEEEYAHRRVAAVDAIADPAGRLAALHRRAVERDHEAESALRAWSRSDPVAADVMRRVDATRVQYLATYFASLGMSEHDARVHADIAVSILAGAQAISRIVDRRKVDAMLREHGRWIRDAVEQGSGTRGAGHRRSGRTVRAKLG
jgi:AcrR family transcriptional regulator